MSHIENDAQRKENDEITSCDRTHYVMKKEMNYDTGEYENMQILESACEFKTLSVAQDKCVVCGKIFTY